MFQRNILRPFSGLRSMQSSSRWLHLFFSLTYSSTLKIEEVCYSEMSHSITTQKTMLLAVTTMRFSNPTSSLALTPVVKLYGVERLLSLVGTVSVVLFLNSFLYND
jgi:hypothetical protein